MKWITRERVKVDRVACPWLIKRFVDPGAEFRFVPESELLTAAQQEAATPFDATRYPEVVLNHRGVRCTFEAILEDFKLTDPALEQLGKIVRAADVKGRESPTRDVFEEERFMSGRSSANTINVRDDEERADA
jgi:Uncharacterized conserved protein